MKEGLAKALRRLLMRRATVVANEPLAENFRRITFEGPALRSVEWVAGQKVQIAVSEAFVTRTYTPTEWDAEIGRMAIVGYAHGNGPGSAWLRAVKPGDACDILGPRSSIDARAVLGPLALFGDETSIGLAAAIAHNKRERSCRCVFEVNDSASAQRVLTDLGIAGATLVKRMDSDVHLAEMDAALSALVGTGTSFVLIGKAGTIQRLRQTLSRHGVPRQCIVTKAYWTPGKLGLD